MSALIVGIIAIFVGVLIAVYVPEVRVWLHLDEPHGTTKTVVQDKVPESSQTHPEPVIHNPPPRPSKKTVKPSSPQTEAKKESGTDSGAKGDGPIAVAPNGIAITGGTVTNPTVNNYGPPPLPTPTVRICVSASVRADQNYTTALTLKTDGKIVQPYYAFFFDGPVLDGKAEMDRHAFGVTQGRADKQPNPETSYLFKVTSIDFGSNVWAPGEEIKVTVPSSQPIKLVRLLFGSEDSPITERIVYTCD